MMTEQEIYDAALLDKAARMTGVDPTTVVLANPFTKSGARARQIQMGVSELDPRRAAEWRREAPGGEISVATLNECMAGGELSPAAMQELWDKDPQFVVDTQRQQQAVDQARKEGLINGAAEKRWQNMLLQTGGDEHAAKRRIEAEDQANDAYARRLAGELV